MILFDEVIAQARASWPGVQVDDARFREWLAARVGAERAAPTLHAGDLYLACACAAGDPTALQLFDEHVLAHVGRWTARLRPPVDVAEVQQRIRERLFVGGSPRIVEYSGRGPLGAWVRIAAVRIALKLQAGRRTEELDGARMPKALDDPELLLIEARYRDAFAAALRDAIARLDERDRVILRLHLVDAVTLPRLAVMYAVDRATIVRWLAAARRRVREATFEALRRRAGGTPEELASVLQLLRSRLDVSLGGLLRHDDLPQR